MKIKAQGGRPIEIEAYGMRSRVLGVYLRFGKGKVSKTREVAPDVFADFYKQGRVLGIEFTRPSDYNIDAMLHVSEVVKVPELRAIDVSRIPVNVQEYEPAGV